MSAGKLLLVIHDPSQAGMYAWLAQQAGFEVVSAQGGLMALTQLERMDVQAVICDDKLSDMAGAELWSVLRHDPLTNQTPFVLLANKAPEGFDAPGDMLARHDSCGPRVLSLLLSKLGLPAQHLPPPLNPDIGIHLQGELSTIGMSDYLHWLCQLEQCGHWLVQVGQAYAHLTMLQGNLVYAEFLGLLGQDAVLSLTEAMDQGLEASFRFYGVPLAAQELSRNINLPTSRLLMEVAVAYDHHQV